MNIMSESLLRTVNVNVILPADKIVMPDKQGSVIKEVDKYKTLYLLHGIFGSQVDWINGTNIQRWAEEKDLAVVMPAGDNAFYIDNETTHNYYGRFIGEELVRLTRKMFPLSDKKEDTFIAGLSMGGYGALRNGLKYHDTFGYVAGLSAACMVDNEYENLAFMDKNYLRHYFGDPEKAKESDLSIKYLVKQNVAKKKNDQKIYIACGVDDKLLSSSDELNELFKKNNYDVTYETGPGAHEWDFWNRYIKHVIDWLPLDEQVGGLNSGNIGDR